MMQLPGGYTTVDLIQKRQDYHFIRVKNESDGKLYFLKIYDSSGRVSSLSNSRMIHEYNVLKKIDSKSVLKTIGLSKNGEAPYLLFDNFDGITLKQNISKSKFDLSGMLKFAIKLTESIDEIHKQQIIHNGLTADDILINLKNFSLKIFNFDNASLISFEDNEAQSYIQSESHLPYISPEQTGRMNRVVDYRSDYYSLGVIFYEMLVGHPPFNLPDPLEMVHCHIARIAPSPFLINSALPEMVSDIIMKLLSKNAEDRYQSATGIVSDFQECLNQWELKQKVDHFEIGQNDHFDVINIPQKLFGRQKEIEILNQLFEQAASGNTGFLTITGYSGIGKTALVHEIYKPLTKFRGYFVSGKFDQLNRNIPYLPILDALRSLIKQILAEPENKIKKWRNALNDVLGNNAAVISAVIPELEFILGSQQKVQELPPAESQNRFNKVFSDFINVFAKKTHPLVIFLDDIQWIDAASLSFLEKFIPENRKSSLLIICAYRSDMLDEHHPLKAVFEKFSENKLINQKINLHALEINNVRQMISESLRSSVSYIRNLADLIFEKTQGNPFFIKQFLRTLFENNLLIYDKSSNLSGQYWNWDINQIKKLGITENVIQLLMTKLDNLSSESKDLLLLASCIGNEFELKTLSIISEKSITKTAQNLWQPLHQGLIIPESRDYKFFLESELETELETIDMSVNYRFLHDKVQQAAYSMIDDNTKEKIHYRIGSLLLKNAPDNSIENQLFDILHHLNRSKKWITDRSEKIESARLNLQAGKKAKSSAAFEAACNYFRIGTEFLSEDRWQTDYNLCWELYSELSEAEYIIGHFDQAEKHFEEVLNNTRTIVERAKILTTKVKLYTHINKVKEALETGLEAAKLLNWPITPDPNRLIVGLEFFKVRVKLLFKTIINLQHLPEMNNQAAKAALELISHMTTAAYFTGPEMIGFLNLKMMQIVLKFGNPESAPFVYSQYALLEGAGAGAYKRAYELGDLALKLTEKHDLPYWKSKTYLTMGAIINHWKKPMSSNLPILTEAYKTAVESGDMLYSLYANRFIAHTKVSMGTNINDLLQEVEKYINYAEKIRHDRFDLMTYRRMLLELKNEHTALEKESYDRTELFQKIKESKDLSAEIQHYICLLKTAYFKENYEKALQIALDARSVLQGSFGQLLELEYRFFTALIIAKIIQSNRSLVKENLEKIFLSHLKKINKWAKNCEENFQHHALLLEAEKKHVLKQKPADSLYEQAVEVASKNGFVHVAAIAAELATNYFLEKNKIKTATSFLLDSLNYYSQWGAELKIAKLKTKHNNLLNVYQEKFLKIFKDESDKISRDISSSVDLETVIRSAQALSSEIRLNKLLKTIMHIVITNAGAEFGLLLLEKNGQLFVEETGYSEKTEVETKKSIAIEQYDKVAHSVVRYVQRSKESLVINDAVKDDNFAIDPHIVKNNVRSVLCMPIMNQQVLKGILYLENNLTNNAFSKDRIELLTILSNEMAISIENALLYEKLQTANSQLEEYSKSLEKKVVERTEDLQSRSDELEKANKELEKILDSLKSTQDQLIHSEKMASLGELTAGIAHEIKNPLNFVNNFAESTIDLITELKENFQKVSKDMDTEIAEDSNFLIEDIIQNLAKINEHGKRADSIIHSMMLHARGSSGKKELTNINQLLEESVNLVYHGMRAQDSNFNIKITKNFDNDIEPISVVSQNLSRVFLNIMNNSCYAAFEKNKDNQNTSAELTISSINHQDHVEIKIKDNGNGIPDSLKDKIFNPFFTTKPTGKGTGLGLSISYDIIKKEHKGSLEFRTEQGKYTEFIIFLPKK